MRNLKPYNLPPPSPPPPSNVYYKSNQLTFMKSDNYDTQVESSVGYKQMIYVTLYSNPSATEPVGQAFFDVSILNAPVNMAYDTELCYFFWDDGVTKSSIQFTMATFSPDASSVLPPGNYDFPITGGSGKYLGVRGYVHYYVSSNGLRTISFVFYDSQDPNI